MTDLKGLSLTVYRPAGYPDCTNGGASGKHNELVLVGTRNGYGPVEPLPKEAQVFSPSENAPAVVLVDTPRICLVPLDLIENFPKGHVGPMSGGNAAGSTDSRWSTLNKIVGGQRLNVVPVHDRIETQALYDALSI